MFNYDSVFCGNFTVKPYQQALFEAEYARTKKAMEKMRPVPILLRILARLL
jgi:hypothetical protein